MAPRWLPGDRGEGGGKEEGRDCAAAKRQQRSERQLGSLPQGTVPRKQEDNFRQTECKENWILQPLTLLLGPL